jgi:hypothetical protein
LLAIGYMPLVVGRVCETLMALSTLKPLALMFACHMDVEGGLGREELVARLASKAFSLMAVGVVGGVGGVVVVAGHVECGRGVEKRKVKVERVLFQRLLGCCCCCCCQGVAKYSLLLGTSVLETSV